MSCVCFDLFINTWRGGVEGGEGVEGGGVVYLSQA